jgi:hypothetical protein
MNAAMETGTVMTILLIRFGLIVACVAVLVLLAFTILLILRRTGRLHTARKYGEYVAPAARAYLDTRGGYRGYGRGGGLLATALRILVNWLDSRDRRH